MLINKLNIIPQYIVDSTVESYVENFHTLSVDTHFVETNKKKNKPRHHLTSGFIFNSG